MTYVRDLTTLYVSSSFKRLLQISGSNNAILDGLGNPVELELSASNLIIFNDLIVLGNISGSLASNVTGVTQPEFDGSTRIATTEYVDNAIFVENLFDRSGSILSPHYPGDSIETSGNLLGYNISASNNLYVSESARVDRIQFNETRYDDVYPIHTEGLVFYDATHKSLAYYNEQNDVTVNIGLETLIRVKNESGVDIADGTPVYSSGSRGHTPIILLAQNTGAPQAEVLGLTTHYIPNNTFGYVAVRGGIHGLDTSMFSDGDFLYLSSSAGELTNITPVSPEYPIRVGQVLNAHKDEGIILVNCGPSDVTNHMVINHATFINGAIGNFSGSFEGSLEISGPLSYNTVEVNTSYSLETEDYYVDVDTSINSCSIQLFDASLVNNGWTCNIGDIAFSASINPITLIASSSQKIHNATSASFSGDGNAITIKSNGLDQWHIR